jgi:hypothetical protein
MGFTGTTFRRCRAGACRQAAIVIRKPCADASFPPRPLRLLIRSCAVRAPHLHGTMFRSLEGGCPHPPAAFPGRRPCIIAHWSRKPIEEGPPPAGVPLRDRNSRHGDKRQPYISWRPVSWERITRDIHASPIRRSTQTPSALPLKISADLAVNSLAYRPDSAGTIRAIRPGLFIAR